MHKYTESAALNDFRQIYIWSLLCQFKRVQYYKLNSISNTSIRKNTYSLLLRKNRECEQFE